jgi:hypothetical protein
VINGASTTDAIVRKPTVSRVVLLKRATGPATKWTWTVTKLGAISDAPMLDVTVIKHSVLHASSTNGEIRAWMACQTTAGVTGIAVTKKKEILATRLRTVSLSAHLAAHTPCVKTNGATGTALLRNAGGMMANVNGDAVSVRWNGAGVHLTISATKHAFAQTRWITTARMLCNARQDARTPCSITDFAIKRARAVTKRFPTARSALQVAT